MTAEESKALGKVREEGLQKTIRGAMGALTMFVALLAALLRGASSGTSSLLAA